METLSVKQPLCSRYRRELLKRQTPSELHMMSLLAEAGLRAIPQKGFIAGKGFCFADFYLPRPWKLVIEVDGGYHATPAQQARDAAKDAYYAQRGFRVLRITNEQVFDMGSRELARLVRERGRP